jgi:anti-sigma factor RsiW
MKHVTDSLAAWAGGELTADLRQQVERHLDDCPDCRADADRLRATWDALGHAALPAESRRPDLWPAVRERTFGRTRAGWFFGRSPAARVSLAVATLAVGVLCGRLGGVLARSSAAADDDDSGLAAVWLEDSTWHGEAGGGLAESWLALADTGDPRGAAAGQGGTK